MFIPKKFNSRFIVTISSGTFINFSIYSYIASLFYNQPLPDGRSLSYYCAVLILISAIIKIIKNEEKLLIDNSVINVILLFYLYAIVSQFFILNKVAGLSITLGQNILIFCIIFYEISKQPQLLKKIKLILMIGGLFISFLISIKWFTKILPNGRVYIFDFNHNELSWLLICSLIIFYSKFLSLKKKISFHNFKNYFVIFLIVTCIMIINALVMIGTRSVLLFLFIIFLIFFTLSYLKKNNLNQNIFFIIINFIFLLFKIYIYTPIHNRLIYDSLIRLKKSSFLLDNSLDVSVFDNSLDIRVDILLDGINEVVNSSFLLSNKSSDINYQNTIINSIVDYGFISLVFIIIIFILIILKYFLVLKKANYSKIFFVTTSLLCLSAILNLGDIRYIKFWWLLLAIFLVKIYSKTKSF